MGVSYIVDVDHRKKKLAGDAGPRANMWNVTARRYTTTFVVFVWSYFDFGRYAWVFLKGSRPFVNKAKHI